MSAEERIGRRKLSDAVFERLEAMIGAGELPVGSTLPSERALMDRFGVGRPAIREALQAMQGLGLIQINHGERARVRALTPDAVLRRIDLPARLLLSASPDNLQHLKQARLLLECGVVRAAAAVASSDDAGRLQDAIAAQRKRLAAIDEFIAHDIAFHVLIAEIAGNPILIAASRAMLGWLRQYRSELLHWSGKESVTIAEHTEIARAIADRDAAAAERAMTRHLERSDELYVHDAARRTAPVKRRQPAASPQAKSSPAR